MENENVQSDANSPVAYDGTNPTERERILALTVQYLSILRDFYYLRPAEAFVYGWTDSHRGADYRNVDFFPYRPTELYTAYFEAIRHLFNAKTFGGWSFGLVQDDPGSGPRIKGARAFVGYEDGELRLQFYNIKDAGLLAQIRCKLRAAFANDKVTVQVFE